MNKISLRKVLYPIETVLYAFLLVIGVLDYFGYMDFYSSVQAKTVAINAGFALFLIFVPLIIEVISKRKLSSFIDIVVCVDLLFSVVAGEALQLYLRLTWWDKFLHFFATAEFALLGYDLAKTMLKEQAPDATKSVMMSVVFAFFFSVAVEAIWEICEFACDCIAGTNMQKYLPPSYYDLIDSSDRSLSLSVEAIAEFFSTSDGYTYALQDTMFDLIVDVCGGAFGCAATALVFYYKPELQDSVVFADASDQADPSLVIEDIKEHITKNTDNHAGDSDTEH